MCSVGGCGCGLSKRTKEKGGRISPTTSSMPRPRPFCSRSVSCRFVCPAGFLFCLSIYSLHLSPLLQEHAFNNAATAPPPPPSLRPPSPPSSPHHAPGLPQHQQPTHPTTSSSIQKGASSISASREGGLDHGLAGLGRCERTGCLGKDVPLSGL